MGFVDELSELSRMNDHGSKVERMADASVSRIKNDLKYFAGTGNYKSREDGKKVIECEFAMSNLRAEREYGVPLFNRSDKSGFLSGIKEIVWMATTDAERYVEMVASKLLGDGVTVEPVIRCFTKMSYTGESLLQSDFDRRNALRFCKEEDYPFSTGEKVFAPRPRASMKNYEFIDGAEVRFLSSAII